MLPPNKDDGTLSIQSAADLLERTDKQLVAALAHSNVAGVATREAITGELQRRELVRLTALTLRLEGLTRWLIGWTIALFVLTGVLVYFTIVLARHDNPPMEKSVPAKNSPPIHAAR
jgi:hypothetical protein